MRTTPRDDSTFEVFDLPPGLAGVYSTDVVFPNGQYAALHGCSLDAHRVLQEQIAQITQGVPLKLQPEALLKLATTQYERRLLVEAGYAA